MHQVDAFLLLDAHQGVEPLLSFTQCPDLQSALEALFTSLEANELWSEFGDVRLVARARPVPLLAAFGRFTPHQKMLLENLSAELNDVIHCHRYVGYAEAEAAAGALAATLRGRFGQAGLDGFRFTAIPRGGWIVLGMLSYFLGLRHDQIGVPGDPLDDGKSQTWVVVDDCALSGLRFNQFVTSRGLGSTIFCPFFAPAGLCEAIQRAEPGVEACLNAVDLRDVAPERYGKAYSQWLEERREKAGKGAYWLGIAENVAFAWCEPQSKYWDKEAGCYRASWSLLPPSLSLSRQQEAKQLRLRALAPERAILNAPRGQAIQEAPRVLWFDVEDAIAVARFPHDPDDTAPCFRLEGSAADMWRCVLEHGTLEGAEAGMLERYDIDPSSLRQDLSAFVAELERNGLLELR
ncbi:PqqD family protein [Halomonas sp. ANAO-440]|nr:PqqD family protein [Halomonas sp. ANAO-440]